MFLRRTWEEYLNDTFVRQFLPCAQGYDYPRWSPLLNELGRPYASKLVTNAIMHFKANWEKFMQRLWMAYFLRYKKYVEEFGELTPQVIETQAGTTLTSNLIRYSGWLLRKNELFEGRSWTIIPMTSHQISMDYSA
ncbi:uncharacterized protein BYT42DRAFT_549971 [Radiomyces spectabilis]|uniref:uncharacterized protein n=1 Tax=Radiomyces spectabilis TaxID=64574 RepID=UPI0022209A9E|nr:uncharacterized protein BYT42DRAFT_549971 [Radiomyces spectabilis]KAI8365983.1 hypothetical protein BYT42DRAFT_549971 [Radiomyces spectabilis]